MKTILFTNARDENNILEWAIHHLNLGFTYIYIYDHLSKIYIKNIMKKIPNVFVDRIDQETIRKQDLMSSAIKTAKEINVEWMLYLDADEFLILPNDDNICSFLRKYDNYNQISINWVLFGSNYHNECPKGTLLESYTKCEHRLNNHIKCFVKPQNVVNPEGPHYYKMDNMDLSVGINYEKMSIDTPWFFNYNCNDINKINAYIAHHVFQSYETFLSRKCLRNRDDTGAKWGYTLDENTLHNYYNNYDNYFCRDKYNEKNKKIMAKVSSIV
jgi:hypothetical protein